MNLEQIQEIFKIQLEQDPKDLFYFVYGAGAATVIRHRLDQQSLQDLAVALEGLEYEASADSTPKFRKI
jgi:hypothetical protein